MMPDFVHVRVHSQYSLLASTIRPRALFETVRRLGMNAVAVTDYGSMFGAIGLYKSAVTAGVKLIFGCGLYVVSGDHRDISRKSSEGVSSHASATFSAIRFSRLPKAEHNADRNEVPVRRWNQ